VTQSCLEPRTNSGVPERSVLLGVPRSAAVLMGSGIVFCAGMGSDAVHHSIVARRVRFSSWSPVD
jgi:hypothetical protein